MSKRQKVFDEVVEITTREDYDKLKARGIDLLFGNHNLHLDINLRKEIQEEVFGKGNHQRNNQKFYKKAWEGATSTMGMHFCEECHLPLREYSATFVSHILSRGAHPEMAYDLRNYNILCARHHEQWENGDREKMRIWQRNKGIIEQLKKEYGNS